MRSVQFGNYPLSEFTPNDNPLTLGVREDRSVTLPVTTTTRLPQESVSDHDELLVGIVLYWYVTLTYFCLRDNFKCYRNPVPELRPSFGAMVLELQHPDFKLLIWTSEDVAAHTEQARTLGAPLEAGENLYADIQHIYRVSTD